MSKFLDNNFFATHLKTLSEHFSKNGGSGNGFLESLPFKAFMNDEIHQVNYWVFIKKKSLIKNTVFEGAVLEEDLYMEEWNCRAQAQQAQA